MENSIFKEYCPTLGLYAMPTFGIYQSDEYQIMKVFSAFHSSEIPKHLPLFLQQKLKAIEQSHNVKDFSFLHVTYDANEIVCNNKNEDWNENKFLRLNVICHPFIFYNCNLNQEHHSVAYVSGFTEDNSFHSVKDSMENDGVRVDLHKWDSEISLSDQRFKREVILHSTEHGGPALSPNNCGILINFNNQLIHFYIVVLGIGLGSCDEIVKCCVEEVIIIPNGQQCEILNTLYKTVNEYTNIEDIQNVINPYIDEITTSYLNSYNMTIINNINSVTTFSGYKELIITMFKEIYKFNKEQSYNTNDFISFISQFYFESFRVFVHEMFNDSLLSLKNFYEDFINYLIQENDLQFLVEKYIQFHINSIETILNGYYHYICGKEKINKGKDNITIKKVFLKNTRERFKKLISAINNDNMMLFNDILEEFEPFIKNYIFYFTWIKKGKVEGIHENFGKLSFCKDEKLSSEYHCSNDEIKDICNDITSILEAFDF